MYLVGHSRGTFVSSLYLSDPARAAKVAKYVALDGAGCPTVVPCIAPNQSLLSGQSHVEVATSKESFALQYEFLVGRKPAVPDLVPEPGLVELSGRAVSFPANTGRSGATLDIWRVDPATGHRVRRWPDATYVLGADGAFGPFRARSGAHSSAPATGTVSVRDIPRGDASRPQTLNVPNWPSDLHSVSVVFTDDPVDGGACTRWFRRGPCR